MANATGPSLRARIARLKRDLIAASCEALRSPQAQRAMDRASLGLGSAVAVVAAHGVHEALRTLR